MSKKDINWGKLVIFALGLLIGPLSVVIMAFIFKGSLPCPSDMPAKEYFLQFGEFFKEVRSDDFAMWWYAVPVILYVVYFALLWWFGDIVGSISIPEEGPCAMLLMISTTICGIILIVFRCIWGIGWLTILGILQWFATLTAMSFLCNAGRTYEHKCPKCSNGGTNNWSSRKYERSDTALVLGTLVTVKIYKRTYKCNRCGHEWTDYERVY